MRYAPFPALFLAIASGITLLAQSSLPADSHPRISITRHASDLAIEIDGKPFTTYRFVETPDDPTWQRPYFWPVAAADGTEVTSDQTREIKKDPKADHPHHRSIWIGHGDVNGANHWTQSPEKQRHVRFTSIDSDRFVEELTWDAKGTTEPVLTETRSVRVLTYDDGSRGLDITSRLTAARGDVTFRCKPLNTTGVEAGLCSIRMAWPIASGPDAQKQIISGAQDKMFTGERAARNNPALWCDFSGVLHGEKYGAALVSAADNPGGAAPFHVRLFGFLADIGPLNWTLKEHDSATFRHLIIVHAGDATAARIDEKARAWRSEK